MMIIMKYPFKEIEAKWKKIWDEKQVYKTDLSDDEKKIYCLVMFIYPSGAKLHCGHWYNYGPTDSWARFKKLQGYNVFEPMGYDAFGLPAENYAIKTGVHPYDSTMKNIEDIRKQLKNMGCMYDWDAEMMTCKPEYYKWNQWLFLQMYKKGLAYRKNAPVNWCSSCQTVLANEQVHDGHCERCDTEVIKKDMTQWFLKITDYAEELLENLDKIDWPQKTKLMQKNWIGKSQGAEIDFKIEGTDKSFTVFTTRPDTLYGVTYCVLAPELSLVKEITTEENKKVVEEYIERCRSLSEIERTSTTREKTGVPTGAFAVNPVNGEKVPILIADYALATYGTGCVMAVPAHDERDFEFATKMNLPIRKVILEEGKNADDKLEAAFTEIGTMINSDIFNGVKSDIGKEKIIEYLEENNYGRRKINYRLHDWLISRQRYWGTPIPIVYCSKCGEVAVPENQLPVELPYNVKFKSDGKSPLAQCEEFINTKCPKCGGNAKREPDTMDTFVDSSWYYLRYLNPKFSDGMFNKGLANSWTPVDMYVGGAEHATMHLLYARFVHKFLRDIKLVNSDEPFTKLIHQGTITNEGAKMSKSKGNVVNPDLFISEYGSDVFRMYLMFMGPYEMGGDWNDKGIVGVDRFVQRVYTLFEENKNIAANNPSAEKYNLGDLSKEEKILYQKINRTIKKYSEEIENFRFNTAVAALMELLNDVLKNIKSLKEDLKTYVLERFAWMLSPIAPHLGEECWQLLGFENSIFELPKIFQSDETALAINEVTIAVQIMGKVRATVNVPFNAKQEVVRERVMEQKNVQQHLDGKRIIKEIYVPNKIYNFVAK